MKELDKNCVYDLSELTNEEREEINKIVKSYSEKYNYILYDGECWLTYKQKIMFIDDNRYTNAKELFYTLENIQVDCRELSEKQIKEMASVFEKNGYVVDYEELYLDDEHNFLRLGKGINEVFVNDNHVRCYTITYEKFMELFGNKEEEYTEFCKAYKYLENTTKSFKNCLTPVLDKAIEIAENIAYKETYNKLNYELDFNFITQLAERMSQNKHKYEPYNWQKLDSIAELKQALYRHVMEAMKGNYEDDNRLFGHLESIALNAMFINYQLNNLNNK